MRLSKLKRREAFISYIFLLPALFLAFVFVIFPVFYVIYLSFTNWDLLKESKAFVGLENFFNLLKDERFLKSVRNTFYFAFLKIPLDLVLSLYFAVLLDKKIRGLRFFRAAYFAPVITPIVASAIIWIWIYDPSFGPLNQILKIIGLKPLKWLYDPIWSMPSIILFSLWKGLGYDIVIFLAGLQSIPEMYREAAMVDGANSRQIFFKITLPLLSPLIYFVILMGFINCFKIFTEISVMTPGGGPLYSTATMVYYIYQQAFESYKIGRASAASFLLFFLILSLTILQRKIGGKYVYQE